MKISKEMEMKKYMTPEMDVVEIKYQTSLLSASEDSGTDPNSGWIENPPTTDD